MGASLLPIVLGAMLGGGPILAWIAIRKAPVERDSMRVDQADKNTDAALSLLEAERERFRELRDEDHARFEERLKPLVAELEALRRDRQHDLEQCRQLTVANEALRDLLQARENEIATLRVARREHL